MFLDFKTSWASKFWYQKYNKLEQRLCRCWLAYLQLDCDWTKVLCNPIRGIQTLNACYHLWCQGQSMWRREKSWLWSTSHKQLLRIINYPNFHFTSGHWPQIILFLTELFKCIVCLRRLSPFTYLFTHITLFIFTNNIFQILTHQF